MQLHGFFLKRERKEAQETIYETLIEIMKKEENCESFNTRFFFGIAFVSASDQLKWCCGICQTKRKTW